MKIKLMEKDIKTDNEKEDLILLDLKKKERKL